MDKDDIGEGEWRRDFRARVRDARAQAGGGKMTPDTMAALLGIEAATYRKYEAPRSGDSVSPRATIMPARHMPKFCKICGIDLEWLISGPEMQAKKAPAPIPAAKRRAG